MPQRSKVIRAAVDGEPALFLNKPQEHQPIEEPLCKQVPRVHISHQKVDEEEPQKEDLGCGRSGSP
jgi:hypothetical protein